jgi:hypothetical protein
VKDLGDGTSGIFQGTIAAFALRERERERETEKLLETSVG